MTETKLPEELEERAMLYALGVMDQEDRRAFELRLQGESALLRQRAAAYQATVYVLSTLVAPVIPTVSISANHSRFNSSADSMK